MKYTLISPTNFAGFDSRRGSHMLCAAVSDSIASRKSILEDMGVGGQLE